jgi:hypothetical protein
MLLYVSNNNYFGLYLKITMWETYALGMHKTGFSIIVFHIFKIKSFFFLILSTIASVSTASFGSIIHSRLL